LPFSLFLLLGRLPKAAFSFEQADMRHAEKLVVAIIAIALIVLCHSCVFPRDFTHLNPY